MIQFDKHMFSNRLKPPTRKTKTWLTCFFWGVPRVSLMFFFVGNRGITERGFQIGIMVDRAVDRNSRFTLGVV